MGVVFCAWAKSKTIDKSLNSAWFICVNWARILNGSVFCRPVNFFIRLKIRPTPCERSLKLFCVFLRWHLKIPVSDCWIQKNYSRTLLTNGHLFTTVTLFCPGGQSIHCVRCKFTCKLAFIWTKQTNPYNQGYIRRTRQSNPYKQEYISSVSSVKNVVTSCESLELIHRVTPYNNKNSSRDLKGRETRTQGTQPQHIDSYLNLSTTATATKACPQLPK